MMPATKAVLLRAASRSPWLVMGLLLVSAGLVTVTIHLITASSYAVSLRWSAGALEFKPPLGATHPSP
jgi:hypothetical protein